MIELFDVPADEDGAFLAAWAADAPPGATLYRALRADVPHRFASVASGGPEAAGGVLLIAPFEVREADDERFLAAWEEVRAVLSARRGYLGAQVLRSPDARTVAVVHWSSPLMYARAVREEGDLIAALPFPAQPALYLRS